MLLWFVLTVLSVLFVAIDITRTPESPVLKWGFILLTAYTGPAGAFLYVLGCREPLPGLHEQYTAARWRQVLGSTMHCVAGDGLGILAGAVIGSLIHLSRPAEIGLEYLLGFGFGWTIFQALFMKESSGGSFFRALKNTFFPELVSMNYLMAAMVVVMTAGMSRVPGGNDPLSAEFWFIMSMALMAGFFVAYPVNWWLVSNHLKHGMMTIRPDLHAGFDSGAGHPSGHSGHPAAPGGHDDGDHGAHVTWREKAIVLLLSLVVLAVGVSFALY